MSKEIYSWKNIGQPNNPAPAESPSFDDLQPLFDAQTLRLDGLLCRPEAPVHTINPRRSRTFRHRMIYAWGVLALYCVIASVYWGIRLWNYQYDIYFRFYALFLEGCFLLLAAGTTYTTFSILRHSPSNTPFDRMLRYAHISGMRPLYLSQTKCTSTSSAAPPVRRKAFASWPRNVGYHLIISNYSRASAIGFAASCILIIASCTNTVGDGHNLTQNHLGRSEAVENVTNIVNEI